MSTISHSSIIKTNTKSFDQKFPNKPRKSPIKTKNKGIPAVTKNNFTIPLFAFFEKTKLHTVYMIKLLYNTVLKSEKHNNTEKKFL